MLPCSRAPVLPLSPRTVSTSSFSSPSKSVRSSVRTLVALLRSASAALIFVVSSSVSDVSDAICAVESCRRAEQRFRSACTLYYSVACIYTQLLKL